MRETEPNTPGRKKEKRGTSKQQQVHRLGTLPNKRKMPPERLQLIRTLAMYNHYSLIPATLISSSISLEKKDQLLTIHSETIWRCMRKHRQPRRSSKYQECYCKTLTWHKHCHLSVLSTCEWQPGICLEHTLECWGKEDASPAQLQPALKQDRKGGGT